MAVKVILEGRLDETVRDGEVLAATLDEGATVGNGVHVRITSVDKHRQHQALRHLAGQRVRVTVEVIAADGEQAAADDEAEPVATPADAEVGAPTTEDRWAALVDKVDQRRRLQPTIA